MQALDQPVFYFRGTIAYPELIDHLTSGKITAKEFVFLLLVDAMVQESSKECPATNTYLAQELHSSPVYVSKMIGKMKRAGLLLVTEEDGKRYMECAWSR